MKKDSVQPKSRIYKILDSNHIFHLTVSKKGASATFLMTSRLLRKRKAVLGGDTATFLEFNH